jgi:hypothetical protein
MCDDYGARNPEKRKIENQHVRKHDPWSPYIRGHRHGPIYLAIEIPVKYALFPDKI